MAQPLIIVSSIGFDAEDVEHARTLSGDCPACEHAVRFVERQLVKNIRVFNVPLLAVEQGARVFQCPHCEACYAIPDPTEVANAGPGATAPDVDATRLAELEDNLTRTEDEVSLWRLRVELARRKGAEDLATEARTLVDRYERAAANIRAELSRLRGAPATAAEPAEATSTPVTIPQPPAPPEKAPEPTPAEVDDEMAALKRMLRKRD